METSVKDLRNQPEATLKQMAEELQAKIRDLRFTVQTRQQTRVRELRNAKRDLARIKTVMNEKKQ